MGWGWILSAAALLAGGGYFAKGVGEGIDNTGNGALKIAAAGAGAYLLAKHFKVL